MLAILALICITLILMSGVGRADTPPFALHPDNPHVFLFRGGPTLLITSAEHYGAVLNLDFDYAKYLDTLAADGMNHTRMFVGAYCEPDGAFKIARNTLAPAAGRFICPWARSDQPGYANGGNKFDLSRWDEAYFARLRDFVSRASERGIVIEINLFCPFYGEEQWVLSPMNARNNVNDLGTVSKDAAYTLDGHGGLLAVQEAMVRKVVGELQGFDNIYYEVMNEPYIRKVPRDWEHHIVDVIVAAEAGPAHRHLISMNIANHQAKVEDPHPAVSLFNFHYAFPPVTVAMNYALGRALGDNETGFAGTSDARYRMEAWAFILAGGALYNNLDYSFTVGHEDGSFAYPDTQPGGGSRALRRQLRALAEFMRSLDFVRMSPHAELVHGLPDGVSAQALAEPGKQYAVYLYRPEAGAWGRSASVALALPAGAYRGCWLDCETGITTEFAFEHAGGEKSLPSPAFTHDVALRIAAAD